jgi:hypothetical protein
MQLARKEEPITLPLLMSKISEYDIYRYEIGDFTIGRAISNPLRKDTYPSLVVYMGESGHLFHRDYADEKYRGGCIDLVMQKYGLNYDGALKKIAKDFGIVNKDSQEYLKITSKYAKPVLDMKKHSLIQVKSRKWEKADLEYWAAFGISLDELRAEDVYCVKEWYLNHRKQYIAPGELCFAYRYPEGFKIYYPTRTKENGKWKSNISTSTVENIGCLKNCSKVLITKSKKDRMVLGKYFSCIISVQNETRSCFTEDFVNVLKGKEVWINFDSDEPGVKNCKIITSEFGYNYINVPKQYLQEENPIKDFADLYKKHGEEPIIKHLKQKGFL